MDLSKIDFTKCKLPDWSGSRIHVTYTSFAVKIMSGSRVNASKSAHHGCDQWDVAHGIGTRTFEELGQLREICFQVDHFITDELAALKLKEEYPMSADEAREFLRTHPGEHLLAWSGLPGCNYAGLKNGEHWHRFDGESHVVKVCVGRWCVDSIFDGSRYRLIESRNVHQELDWVSVPWQDVEWLEQQGIKVLKQAGDSTTFKADRGTLPFGYDPSEPRWVNVTNNQVARLYGLNCAIAIRGGWRGPHWCQVANPDGDKIYEYAVDIHTLTPGIKLHEETKPEPAWATLKWTEVERLDKAGAHVQWSRHHITGEKPEWRERDGNDQGAAGFANLAYRVDLRTVPDGVELYEPDWVEIVVGGGPGEKYRADRKTFPAGYEANPSPETPAPKRSYTDMVRDVMRQKGGGLSGSSSAYLSARLDALIYVLDVERKVL